MNVKQFGVMVTVFALLASAVTLVYGLSGPWGFSAGTWLLGGLLFVGMVGYFALLSGMFWALDRFATRDGR